MCVLPVDQKFRVQFTKPSCRPEISCAVHQAARFTQEPHINHTGAVKQIACSLKDNIDKGTIMKPTVHSFKIWVNSDYRGLRDKETAIDKPATAKSRTRYTVTYCDCPIIWESHLQLEIALSSTTEAEYIALSTA